MATERAYELLERISALLRTEQRKAGAALGLEPVHLGILAYLARANCFSDTPQAVGEYLGLTKGNISQRLIWLQGKGLLRREPDSRDRRVVRLRLTPQGRSVLHRLNPPELWRESCDGGVERPLERILGEMLARRGYRTFGQCRTCRYHERKSGSPYCGLMQVQLKTDQADRICREHEAGDGRAIPL